MPAYSADLRQKIVEAYRQGDTSIRIVARRFRVSPGVVQRALNQYRLTGNLTPNKSGGPPPSKLAGHEDFVLSMVDENPDWTLQHYCDYIAQELDVHMSLSALCRFLQKHNRPLKQKTYRTAQSQTDDCQKKR